MTQINVVKSNGIYILKAPSAAAIRRLTWNHSLDLSVDFTTGGKLEEQERDQLQQPRPTWLNLKFSGESNALISSANSVLQTVCCILGSVEIQIEIEKGWCTADTPILKSNVSSVDLS